jgi:hypothetical protein
MRVSTNGPLSFLTIVGRIQRGVTSERPIPCLCRVPGELIIQAAKPEIPRLIHFRKLLLPHCGSARNPCTRARGARVGFQPTPIFSGIRERCCRRDPSVCGVAAIGTKPRPIQASSTWAGSVVRALRPPSTATRPEKCAITQCQALHSFHLLVFEHRPILTRSSASLRFLHPGPHGCHPRPVALRIASRGTR